MYKTIKTLALLFFIYIICTQNILSNAIIEGIFLATVLTFPQYL